MFLMETKTIELNNHEILALQTCIEKYMLLLDEQISSLKNAKHLDNPKKKELQNTLGKRKDLLKAILTRI